VNGDGYADVIVGAYLYDAGLNNQGAAFVFLGSASGIADGNPPWTAAARLKSDQVNAILGISVSGAGDVNGDGYADVIVGARHYDAGQNNEGAAFVFLGNGDGDGRPVVARQLRGDASGTPAHPWGGSYSADAFEVRVRATHPEGRGRVKLEVETCEAGLAFGDVSCASQTAASWSDVTATSGGVELGENISGLTEDMLYRWRARVLYAPYSVTEAGITSPPNPAHGPWRRLMGQAEEADLRTNQDTDGDGLIDLFETGTGVWSSPTDTGTNPLLADTDGDGLEDGVETNTDTYVDPDDTGTDPNKWDSDGDGFSDGAEVLAGTDPTDSDSFPLTSVPSLSGPGIGLLVGLLLLIPWAVARRGRGALS